MVISGIKSEETVQERIQGRMRVSRFLLYQVMALCSVVFLSAGVGQALTGDELYLTGVIKSIDRSTGTVYVDVLTQGSCRGLRAFHANKLDELEPYVNERVSISIDSVRCSKTTISSIIAVSQGVRK